MFSLAKGIGRYIGIAALAVGMASRPVSADSIDRAVCEADVCPVNFTIKSYEHSKSECSPDFPDPFSESSVSCSADISEQVNYLKLTIDKSDYSLRLDAILDYGARCTIASQRTIVGKNGWETPEMERVIDYATVNPYWHIPKSILAEMTAQHSSAYMQQFYHKDGVYMPPGERNPLGKVAFNIKDGNGVKLHGTVNKDLFDTKKREYSHGCIRTEDEVSLLKMIAEAAGTVEGCAGDCIDEKIASGKTTRISFKRPVLIKIIK